MSNFDSLSHPNYADYEAGRQDGCDYNAHLNPADRKDVALTAYLAGFSRGQEDLAAYIDEQDE